MTRMESTLEVVWLAILSLREKTGISQIDFGKQAEKKTASNQI